MSAATLAALRPAARRVSARISTSMVAMIALALLVATAINGYGSDYYTVVALGMATYVVLGLGLNVVLGYAGLLDIGYAAFFAIGAYASAICTLKFGINFFLSIPVAIAATGIAGVIIGYPTLRLRPDYLAIATIGFGEVVRTIVNNWEFAGSSRGLYPLPPAELFGLRFDTLGLQLTLVCVLVAVALVLSNRLGVSHVGRAWRSIRDDDYAAEAIGVPSLKLKIGAYVGGGVIGALAGVVFASRSVAIDPTNFTLQVSVQVLMIVVLGGLGSVRGVFVAALIFGALPEILRAVSDYRMLIFSVLIIVMLRVRPEGIIAERRDSHDTGLVEPSGAAADGPPDGAGAAAGGSPEQASDGTPTTPVEPSSATGSPAKAPAAAGSPATPSSAAGSSRRRASVEPGATLLQVEHVSQRFGGVQALDDVSFTVHGGEVFGLIGPNGAGKSTMVNAITGVNKPVAGSVALAGEALVGKRPHKIADLGVSRTFQGIRLFGAMSVLDNVIAGEYGRCELGIGAAILSPRREGRYRAGAVARARAALARAGLPPEAAERRPQELSYPEQRRVEIARALVSEPLLLMLDEPAAGMTPTEKAELVTLLREIVAQGTSIVLIEHDMPLVTAVADRVAVLDQGKLIALGDVATVMRDPKVIEAYLGASADDAPDGDEEVEADAAAGR